MPEQFLYQRLDAASGLGLLNKDISDSIRQNLNPDLNFTSRLSNGRIREVYPLPQRQFSRQGNPLHLRKLLCLFVK